MSVALHSSVTAYWLKYHCYKQAASQYELRCLKATIKPNKQIQTTMVKVCILLYTKKSSIEKTSTACRKLRGTFILIVRVGHYPQLSAICEPICEPINEHIKNVEWLQTLEWPNRYQAEIVNLLTGFTLSFYKTCILLSKLRPAQHCLAYLT